MVSNPPFDLIATLCNNLFATANVQLLVVLVRMQDMLQPSIAKLKLDSFSLEYQSYLHPVQFDSGGSLRNVAVGVQVFVRTGGARRSPRLSGS